MAEVVGLVVGLASFGVQLIESTKKLKTLCEDIKNAPTELQDTIEEIEVMNEIISEMASLEDQPYAGAGALARSIGLCQKALDRLTAVTNDLQNRLGSSNKIRARFSVILKKDSMDRLIRRLEQCKGLLQLAHQVYMGAQNMSRFDLQRQTLEELRSGQMTLVSHCKTAAVRQASTVDDVQTGQVELIEDAISTPQGRRSSRPHEATGPQHSVRSFRIRTPRWTFSRVLEMTVAQTPAGWTASLQFYRIGVPWDDPFFYACVQDDLIAVKELLQARKATPYDQYESEFTAIDHAMICGAFDVSRYLHQHASLPTPQEVGVDPSNEIFQKPPLNSFTVPVESIPASERLDLMMAIIVFPHSDNKHWLISCNMLKDIIRGSHLDPALLDANVNDGKSLMHIFASLLAISSPSYVSEADKQAVLSRMEPMVAECISRGADLTAQGKWNSGYWFNLGLDGLTPLAVLVHRFYGGSGRKKYFKMDQILRDWAQVLAHSGVDLMVYGASETALNLRYINLYYNPQTILGFAYGPEPKDWHFLFSAEHDHWVGQFWRMVEEPERQIPGAWIEQDSDKEDWREAKRMEKITARKLRKMMKKTKKHRTPTF
ncbi:hypothetical protein M409DRAFT_61242 [Zasmidium cellare ATCC 36951]|uniref:Fungal N-terminal domain-containing protein n=1 Tax=Zasmidium cellare ATCC 36951 TaxID=1080233 RepID=A0A6A6BVP5_ZASCE|nr:uncharacterized protein M409DRAFT_61242 [Zasmidium cellare ATCC 36951]KAF2158894.1 hypothetical protein M409DRAFT_61242 [Zasmidium cellare ATCC 36951]